VEIFRDLLGMLCSGVWLGTRISSTAECSVFWKVATPVLNGRTNNERLQPTRLTDHFALLADAALAFVCESLYASENRIGVEMRFRNHIRFEAAASPGIVEVGRH